MSSDDIKAIEGDDRWLEGQELEKQLALTAVGKRTRSDRSGGSGRSGRSGRGDEAKEVVGGDQEDGDRKETLDGEEDVDNKENVEDNRRQWSSATHI